MTENPVQKGKEVGKGGMHCRHMVPFKLPLSSIILLLKNKLDFLHGKWCAFALTESCMDESFVDTEVSFDGFRIIRAGRTRESARHWSVHVH